MVEGQVRTELQDDGGMRELGETAQRSDAEQVQPAQHLDGRIGQHLQRQRVRKCRSPPVGTSMIRPACALTCLAACWATNLLEATPRTGPKGVI